MSEFNPTYEIARRNLLDAKARLDAEQQSYENLRREFFEQYPKARVGGINVFRTK